MCLYNMYINTLNILPLSVSRLPINYVGVLNILSIYHILIIYMYIYIYTHIYVRLYNMYKYTPNILSPNVSWLPINYM